MTPHFLLLLLSTAFIFDIVITGSENAQFDFVPLCSIDNCICRESSIGEKIADDEQWSSGYSKSEGSDVVITATCRVDIFDDTIGPLLAESTAVRNLILIPSGNGTRYGGSINENAEEDPITIFWKTMARNPPLNLLDLSSVQLSCSCENSWLAYWSHSLTQPLVSPESLSSLTDHSLCHFPPNTTTTDRHHCLDIINEEPTCPFNCSLTTAELFHLPKRIIFGMNNLDPANHSYPFSHCLPAEQNPLSYFAHKCSLHRLSMDVENVVQNETDPLLVTCSRSALVDSRSPLVESVEQTTMNTEPERVNQCPSLRLLPFMTTKRSNYSGEKPFRMNKQRQQWPFMTKCLSDQQTIGEKSLSSRNESGWLLCQDQDVYMPQAALTPHIVAGPPQILHFHEDHQTEQLHLTFYVVGYPRSHFGWHHVGDDKWLKPGSTKGFEVILTSRPSIGYYIISGRATFSELSMNCVKGNYDFEVCNRYGCDKRSFYIAQGMPSLMCPPPQLAPGGIQLLDKPPAGGPPWSGKAGSENAGAETRRNESTKKKVTLLFYPSTVSTPGQTTEQENWVYIAVPFLVVVAVVTVGVLTTCLFLRLVGGGINGNQHQCSGKNSSWRYKHRSSLSEWELSPLNQQHFEVNASYVDWLHHIKTRVRVFPISSLTIIKELGEGAFGRVMLVKVAFPNDEHSYVNCEVTVSTEKGSPQNTDDADVYYAMKLLKNVTPEKLEDLEREAAIMSQLDHPNIVQFFGLSCNNGSLALLFEYMQHGDLVTYLRNHSPENDHCEDPLHWDDLLKIALQIAKGLEYLAERHLVHRDLAARNCLVGKDMVVKISDFGMTRDIYITDYYKMGSRTLVPLRWLPPESILYRKFTTESDIWSFGVLVWEIFSYGKIPWYMHSNCEVLQIIQDGKLLERPKESPEDVYSQVMLKCWTKQPSERISASAVRAKLEELLEVQCSYSTVVPTFSSDLPEIFIDS